MGAHGSRTLMLPELQRLFAVLPPDASVEAYRSAVIDDNALLKGTVGTRKETWRRLRELYALDVNVSLFRALRALWDADVAAQPMLALLAALARDPTLRVTAEPLLTSTQLEVVSASVLSEAIRSAWPARYGPRSLINLGRNTASTWTQSGHLRGRTNKRRSQALATPVSAAFALLIGHLCGHRGDALLTTLWTRALDVPANEVRALAFEASRQGWMEYRAAGGVTEVGFQHLLGEDRRR